MNKATLTLVVLCWCAVCGSQTPRADVSGAFLLSTEWGGTEPLNMFAPPGTTLGCHANAFAQVMYFHRLAPHGQLSYTCTDGTVISEDFAGYTPEWHRFALTKESGGEDIAATRRTAQYLYYAACVVRKDFGIHQYIDYRNDFHKHAIESHYDCTLTAFAKHVSSGLNSTLREHPDFYALLKDEIDASRPAGFYYTDRQGRGHAVVIDGYVETDTKTFFHVNFGWLGRSDGWYLLEEDLPPATKEVALILIAPNLSKAERP